MNQFQFDSHQRRLPYIITAVVAGIVGAFLVIIAVKFTGLGVALVNPPLNPEPAVPRQEIVAQPLIINNYEKNTIAVVNKVRPSVVMITTSSLVEDFDLFYGFESRNIQGLGSGVVFRNDGYILTNKHVVSGVSATVPKISVVFPNGRSYAAKVVGVDPLSDVAVLKVNVRGLTVPTWANSDQVQVGQTAIAIGNPLTENLKNTVTVGVVSATGRSISSEDTQLKNMIQTDASINPGNSGGPLLDSNGRIIGINTAIAKGSQGIGFAIPSNTASNVALQLITKGYVTRPGIGVTIAQLTPENIDWIETRLGHALPVHYGALIINVIAGSPADQGGLRRGDIIFKVNGKSIKDTNFIDIIGQYSIGARLKLEFYRGSRIYETTLKIGQMRS